MPNNNPPVVIEFTLGDIRRPDRRTTVEIDSTEWDRMTAARRQNLVDEHIANHPGWTWQIPDPVRRAECSTWSPPGPEGRHSCQESQVPNEC